MKEKYVYSNGKILISDDNYCEGILEKEYQDNIEQILETENIIEWLNQEKENYKESIELKQENIKHNKKSNKKIIISAIIVGVVMMIGDLLMNPFLFMKGMKWWIGILTSSGFIALSTPVLLNNLKNIKEIENDIKGINLASKKLENELTKNENLLINLKNNKTNKNELSQDNQVKNISLKKLRELKSFLVLYASIGSNEKLFKEYYKNGLLESKLNGDFNKEEINEIKKYFKTK